MNEQPWLKGDIQNREKLGKILRCSFCRVFNARFELHLIANGELLRFLWQGKWPVKKHVLGWLVWQQLAGWTCEKRNWRQRDSGQVQGDQSLRQKGKEAECGLSWSTPTVITSWGVSRQKQTWSSESQKQQEEFGLLFWSIENKSDMMVLFKSFTTPPRGAGIGLFTSVFCIA